MILEYALIILYIFLNLVIKNVKLIYKRGENNGFKYMV